MSSNFTFEQIGRLSFEFNRVGFFTAILFSSFHISSKSGFRVLEEDGISTLLHKIQNYIAEIELHESGKEELNSLITEIEKFKEERNNYIHSLILKTEESNKNQALDFIESLNQENKVYLDIDQGKLEVLIAKGQTIGQKIIYASINLGERTQSKTDESTTL